MRDGDFITFKTGIPRVINALAATLVRGGGANFKLYSPSIQRPSL